MSGPRRKCHPLPPFHPPTSKVCQPPAWGRGPSRSPPLKLGLGGVKPGMLRQWGWGGEGSTTPPHPQFLAFTATGSSAAKDSQGPGRPRPQPGGLAPRPLPGPAARPTRLTQPARGWLSGEQTLTSRTSQRRWPGFRQQLPVLEGDLGSSGPAHQTPRLAYHHVMTLHF